jgi:hypothetical protein
MTTFDIPPAFPSWVRPSDGEWWITSDSQALTFSVKEVAKIFFRKSGSWLRMRMQEPGPETPGGDRHPAGWFTGEDITVPLQVNRVQGRAETYEFRRFTLQDVERMIWSLYRHEVIETVHWYGSMQQTGKRGEHRLERYNAMMAESTLNLEIRIELVKWMGRLYGLVPMPAPAVTYETTTTDVLMVMEEESPGLQ